MIFLNFSHFFVHSFAELLNAGVLLDKIVKVGISDNFTPSGES